MNEPGPQHVPEFEPGRVAAIDCGTNSMRLLVADVREDGSLVDVDRRMEIVRLGQNVDTTGRIAPEAMSRTLDAARRYAEVIRGTGATRVRFVATSATRDAENRQEFADGIKDAIGVLPEVVSGRQEAALSFSGALRTVRRKFSAPFLVVDLGGGSTEVALGEDVPTAAYSMDVGCVRITERHLYSDPPARDQLDAARADIRNVLDVACAQVPFSDAATLVGLAGSVTTVTAHALGLERYERSRINGAELTVAQVMDACADLWSSSRTRLRTLPYLHPGRVDVIAAGALVWSEVVQRVAVEAAKRPLTTVVTSEHDILDGIALSAAATRGAVSPAK